MGLREDCQAVLSAIVAFQQFEGDTQQGRYLLSGQDLGQSTGIPPERLNDAVELLERKEFVAVVRWMGTIPFSFGEVELTALGRLSEEQTRESAQQRTSPPGMPPGSVNQSGGITAQNVYVSTPPAPSRPALPKPWYQKGAVQAAMVATVPTLVLIYLGIRQRGEPPVVPPSATIDSLSTPAHNSTGRLPKELQSDPRRDGRVWLSFDQPASLARYILSLPPLTRRNTLDSTFIGSWVLWQGTVQGLGPHGTGYVVSTSYVEQGIECTVAVFFQRAQRPAIEPIREGDTLTYTGRLIPAGIPRIDVHEAYFDVDSAQVISIRRPLQPR
jgi:hypothetical protein